MTKKELLELLAPYSDDVIIYVMSDHGQTPEQSQGVLVSKDEELPPTDFDGEMAWRYPDTVTNIAAVTAICI